MTRQGFVIAGTGDALAKSGLNRTDIFHRPGPKETI
jgi:hypothetical protein